MSLRTPRLAGTSLLLSLLLLTTGIAGCIGDDPTQTTGDDGPEGPLPWASFQDVRNGSGGPIVENGSIEVQWLGPAAYNDVEQDSQPLRIHVVDQDTEEPVTDATVGWASWMPVMGHGTGGEEDPEHVDYGVYEGIINPSMEGQWDLRITVDQDGETTDVEIPYHVGAHAALQAEQDREDEDEEEDAPEPFEAMYEDAIESDTAYEASWPVTVESTDFTIDVSIAFTPTLPAANLTVTLASPSDEPLDTVEMTGEDTGSITVEDVPAEGAYTLEVQGSAIDASYTIEVTVA